MSSHLRNFQCIFIEVLKQTQTQKPGEEVSAYNWLSKGQRIEPQLRRFFTPNLAGASAVILVHYWYHILVCARAVCYSTSMLPIMMKKHATEVPWVY